MVAVIWLINTIDVWAHGVCCSAPLSVGQPLVQRHSFGSLLEHSRGVQHLVHKVDFLCCPDAGGRFWVVDCPFRAAQVTGMPVQDFRQRCAPGQSHASRGWRQCPAAGRCRLSQCPSETKSVLLGTSAPVNWGRLSGSSPGPHFRPY